MRGPMSSSPSSSGRPPRWRPPSPSSADTGYVGLAVHATARLSAAAHGGQIILSRAALRSLANEMVEGATFIELGSYRLRGLPEPETLYQLTVIDLPGLFPPPAIDPR